MSDIVRERTGNFGEPLRGRAHIDAVIESTKEVIEDAVRELAAMRGFLLALESEVPFVVVLDGFDVSPASKAE